MNLNEKPYKHPTQVFSTLILFVFLLCVSACSNSAKHSNSENQSIQNQQKVELGTVVAVRKVEIPPEEIDSYGNFGISASSGGFHGVYGSVDLATLRKIFRNNSSNRIAQEIIVKKASGETVAITQNLKESFKAGEAVKILSQRGKAKVTH